MSHLPGKVLLWTIAVYHVATGLLIIGFGELSIRFAEAFYGWTIQGGAEQGILAELLGCYAVAFGLMMAVAARDPAAHRDLLTVGVVLIALRVVQRIVFAGKIIDTFQVDPGRHWLATGFIFCLGAGVAWLRWQVVRERSA